MQNHKTIRCLPGLCLALLTMLLAGASCPARDPGAPPARLTLNFDGGWRFLKADVPDAAQTGFDDATWRHLDVPHDWSIEGPFAATNATRGSGGFLPSGVGWYRKSFTLPGSQSGRRVFVEFDGVMANSEVWINGHSLGWRPNGYVSFIHELTDHLVFGDTRTNVLAVRTDTSEQPASRWYTGAGIYRHVRLVITDPVHFIPWDTCITTPQVNGTEAVVRVRCAVTNQSASPRTITLDAAVFAPDGRNAGNAISRSRTVMPGQMAVFSEDLRVRNPKLWSLEHPTMYRMALWMREGQVVQDETSSPFGIRISRFEPATGFWLNGENFKIKGVCLHHDGGAFGAAVPLAIWERRLEQLRALGANAIRTAHNPPAPEFLDLCDRMGFLVMDEFFDCWTVGKNKFDYHLYFTNWSKLDASDTIRRDRNHPSVILYSVGNEIHDTPKARLAIDILTGLVNVCHENDPTRPVTQALFRPNSSGDYRNGLADLLDVIGTNYRDSELLAAHRDKPGRRIIGTEQGHTLETWLLCRDNPAHAGQFLWTGIDYLGEARQWPRIGFNSGLLDRTGAPHSLAFQRQSWWSAQPMVHAVRRVAADERNPDDPGYEVEDLRRPQVLVSDWSPRNPQPHDETVEVYSNCESVELLLNGRSLGVKSQPREGSSRRWIVPFQPGTLKAIGRNQGRTVARQELTTAGKPAGILLTVDRRSLSPAWDDVVQVRCTLVDRKGARALGTSARISFSVQGPGRLVASDNGSDVADGSFQQSERQTLQGQCCAWIRATGGSGRIIVSATAPGLEPGTVTLKAIEIPLRPDRHD